MEKISYYPLSNLVTKGIWLQIEQYWSQGLSIVLC